MNPGPRVRASAGRRALALALLAVAALAPPVLACDAPPPVWRVPAAGPAIGATTGRLRILAIGSSSTAGIGALRPDRSYPAVLERMLRERLPGDTVVVLNRGISGATVATNLETLDRDLAQAAPSLVLWQVGTNDALRGRDPTLVRAELRSGIDRIQARGAKVVVIGPQALADVERDAALAVMNEVVAAAALAGGAVFLDRQALMRHWLIEDPLAGLIGPDGLHMTDASYACLAQSIARLIAGGR